MEKLNRLKKRADFVRLSASGRRAAACGLVVQCLSNGREDIRVGFTVTKKIGNAVKRNRVRRRLKEVVRYCLPSLAKKGHDYVVIGRSAALERSFDALKKDFIFAVTSVQKARTDQKDG